MLPAIHVPTSAAGLGIAAVQCLNLASCFNEASSPAPYSKFAAAVPEKQALVSSRTGMFVIYAPALVVSSVALATAPAANGREALVAALLAAHMLKRCLEVAFVHAYSGKVALSLSCAIGSFYGLVCLLITATQRGVPHYAGAPVAALCLYAVGELGNLYHHRGGSSDYVVPTGAGFDLCTMPHYLFEIVAWLGVAAAAGQLNAASSRSAWLLGGRARRRWYEAKFGAKWPKDRAHLVPGVF
ncbi:3-oxo-5-alpha-steroid 4-dehydrogenase [Aureococcus anophagefferens]|nr:3-oxo-5-alpha-steroid 4-dehydrogenase [Aureococcus anophagefferens]